MSAVKTQPTDLLFLCVANSARSQLAEGLARAMAPDAVAVHSAGSNPGRLHPSAVQVLAEIGIDISQHHSKAISEIPSERIATVITLCAEEVCPIFPGEVEVLHWPLPDPAAAANPEADLLEQFRETRDEIQTRLRRFFAAENEPERSRAQ
jgi:arsenate reductase